MSLLANIHRGKDVKAFTPDDFMPKEKGSTAEQAQTWQQQLAMVQMLNAAFKGKRVKKIA